MLVDLYIGSLIIAFITSVLVLYKTHAQYIILFVIILGCDVILEISANYLLKLLHLRNNTAFYNIAMLIEFWGYAYYYKLVLRNGFTRKIIKVYLILFPILWVYLVFFVLSFNQWNSYVSITGSLAMIILSVCMYHQLFTDNRLIRLTRSFEFWIASGLIIFYTCNFVYLGMLNYLSKEYRMLAYYLLKLLQILNIVFYGIVTYSFICIIQSTRKRGNNSSHFNH